MAIPSKDSFWTTRGIPRIGVRDVSDAARWFASKVDHEMSDLAINPFKGPRLESGMLRQDNIGSMYVYGYYAKWDKKLPTWDKFPLCFILNVYKDGFLGLNFHYLPIFQRYLLGSELMKNYAKRHGNRRDYVRLSYPILQSIASSSYYEPCIKRYLYKQMRTPFKYVHPDEWAMAVAVPVQRFVRGNPYNG